MSRTFQEAVTFTRLSAGTRFNRLGLLATEPDNAKRMQHDPATLNTSTQQINVGGVRRGQALTVALDGDHVYAVGDDVYVTDAGNIDRFVAGRVTAAEAGAVTIVARRVKGVGTASDWVVIVGLGLLVEGSATNFLLHSEDLTDSFWIKTGSTITPSETKAPDGEITADKVVEDTTDGVHRIAYERPSNTETSLSFFAKAGERKFLQVRGNNTNILVANTTFDLGEGKVLSTSSGVESFIEPLPNGWFRCKIDIVFVSNNPHQVFFNLLNDDLSSSYVGDGASGLFLWGLQRESVKGAFSSYIRTTTASATRAPDVVSQGEVGKWLTGSCTFISRISVDHNYTNLRVLHGNVNQFAVLLYGTTGDPGLVRVDTRGVGGAPSSGINPGPLGEIRTHVVSFDADTGVASLYIDGQGPVTATYDPALLVSELTRLDLDGEISSAGGGNYYIIKRVSDRVLPYALTEAEAIEASKL